jgi:dihydrofolate reductase
MAGKFFKALAAMAENRVIGRGGQIPWHLPEDFKWFKEMTQGNIVIMGRKTFEGLGRPLPGRTNCVLTRHPRILARLFPGLYRHARIGKAASAPALTGQLHLRGVPGGEVRLITHLGQMPPDRFPCDLFICGGAEVYALALPYCSDLYLTHVKRAVEGDVLFPAFEEHFEPVAQIRETPDFRIVHYRQRHPRPL